MERAKKLLSLQALILLGGIIFSWAILIRGFRDFYEIYGTLFRVRDCVISNPVVTPCFYGALAFVGALVWTVYLIRAKEMMPASEMWLSRFLLFGVVFALSVLGYETAQYYKLFAGPGIGCTAETIPWKTPCFYGAMFFISAYIVSRIKR